MRSRRNTGDLERTSRIGSNPSPRGRTPPTVDRRLKLGYVSGDFGPHPVGFFIKPVLENHDRSAYELYCYSNAPHDELSERLSRQCDHWINIAELDDRAVCERIRSDGIDILVDLAGHTNRGRLSVFARHPAPIQLTWLGYLNTTGLRAMDYRIVDAHTDPEGSTEHLHSERLVRMPHSQWCYYAWHEVDVIRVPHPETPGRTVFGSFNQYAKITDRTLALWSLVLERVTDWELIVFDVRHSTQRDLLSRRMLEHGIDAARVKFRGREPMSEYLRAIGNVDIAFDTAPYNGATTTLDVLWMGVPVVGLYGDRGVSRSTCSILRTLGLDELVAETDAGYREVNLQLVDDATSARGLARYASVPHAGLTPHGHARIYPCARANLSGCMAQASWRIRVRRRYCRTRGLGHAG